MQMSSKKMHDMIANMVENMAENSGHDDDPKKMTQSESLSWIEKQLNTSNSKKAPAILMTLI